MKEARERAQGAPERDRRHAPRFAAPWLTTPKGRRRRVDYVLAHPNGSATAVEVKNVREVRETHVRQAEDHRAGLQNLGFRSGTPVMFVPAGAIVSE